MTCLPGGTIIIISTIGGSAAFKALDDTVECSASVSVDPARISVRMPEDFTLPPGQVGNYFDQFKRVDRF